MLNELYSLNLSDEVLENYASKLGSDCPFFIKNKECLAQGRGELLKEISLDLKGYWLLVMNPKIHVSTKLAYAQVVPQDRKVELVDVVNTKKVEDWSKFGVINDFEVSVFNQFPGVLEAKELIASKVPKYVSMTGSGASVFGVFSEKPSVDDLKGFDFRLIKI